MKVERNRVGNKYTFTPEEEEDEKFLDNMNKYIDGLEEENKKLKEDREKINSAIGDLVRENRKLKEEVRFLEECLDRKEKLNEKYRKELDELKSTYVYDAKQVRDIC